MDEQKLTLLIDAYGLEILMLQNDIEEATVLRWLIEEDMIDMNDYFFSDEPGVGSHD